MTTLDDFISGKEKKQQKAAEKKERTNKLAAFYMKWSLTKEKLTDHFGNVTSDNVARKAMRFLELDCVQKMKNQPGGQRIYWIVEPMPGYNVTTYTAWHYIDNDTVVCACNCQYCKTKGRMCSHILAILILNKVHLLKRWVKKDGVRDYAPKRE